MILYIEQINKMHKEKFIKVLNKISNLILQEKQIGEDINFIKNTVKKENIKIDESSFNELYTRLGAKELFLETLVNEIIEDEVKKNFLNDLSNKIKAKSGRLINNYAAAVQRNKMISTDEIMESEQNIQEYTSKFFNEFIMYLNR